MICDFVVGDEVVCVDDSAFESGANFILGIGEKYQISEIELKVKGSKAGRIFVRLVGFPKETQFRHERFRKLQKKKTDIYQFKEMLNNDLDKNVKELREKEMKRDLQPV